MDILPEQYFLISVFFDDESVPIHFVGSDSQGRTGKELAPSMTQQGFDWTPFRPPHDRRVTKAQFNEITRNKFETLRGQQVDGDPSGLNLWLVAL